MGRKALRHIVHVDRSNPEAETLAYAGGERAVEKCQIIKAIHSLGGFWIRESIVRRPERLQWRVQ